MPVYNPHVIEPKWQQFWEQNKTFRALESDAKPKLYVLDMFPYPSGEGLHVGHPEGYTATDMWCRFKRMRGFNVLHPMGYDAFGLPAEQYAIQTGTHPRETTERNIANIRRQIKRLGFSYDWDREFATTDIEYVTWTQWIFLVLHDTWFDAECPWTDPLENERRGKGRPISELPIPPEIAAQGAHAVRRYQDSFRLAYQSESPVNWCAELGTVLADEEVIDGRSERGDHPVQRIPLRQWMLRITAYADRLVEDLNSLDWPEPIKEMQRNWVGRSEGAEVDFFVSGESSVVNGQSSMASGTSPVSRRAEHAQVADSSPGFEAWKTSRASNRFAGEPDANSIRIYTTRPDTLFGATYMVLAPEHPLVDRLTTSEHRAEVESYRAKVASMSEEDRIAGRGEKTGVFTGGFATNPVNGERVPVWIADYVLISYGTGAIMAVPGHDERDFEFAKKFALPICAVMIPPDEWLRGMGVSSEEYVTRIGTLPSAFCDLGVAMQSANAGVSLNGLATPEAKKTITRWLESAGLGRASVKYKLRDWLFSRQRYWGEPFPIVHEVDEHGEPNGLTRAVLADQLPVRLPDLEDYKPSGRPEPPLEKATDWVWLRDSDGQRLVSELTRASTTHHSPLGTHSSHHAPLTPHSTARYRRETNTMPQWAGSCWYYLRFCDPRNSQVAWDPAIEKYWMPVDLYVGGAEHAVLHLLYSRFWHKVLFDRGHVSTIEPFQRLVNQGMILSISYYDATGRIVPYANIKFGEGKAVHAGTAEELEGQTEKMSKSRGNVIAVDIPLAQYGADTTRLYEMFMGPLEATKPWSMQGVEGISRFLNRAWRMIVDEDAEEMCLNPAITDGAPTDEQLRVLHKTIKVVTEDIEALRFNTAISRLMEFVNFFTGQPVRPRECIEPFVLMLAPLAPHIAEEIWQTLSASGSLAYEPWPTYDPNLTRDDTIEIPVQINGKVRSRIVIAADATKEQVELSARSDAKIQALLEGKTIKKVIAVPGKLINLVVG
jgi:leucyl-tRNA synthetase